jgi:hypothetical protein
VRLVGRGVDTTGRVIQMDPRAPGVSTKVTLAYATPSGQFEVDGPAERQLHIGDEMAVRYHPDKPDRATTLLNPWRQAFIGIPLLLVALAMSGGMVTSGVWYFRGTHTSLQLPLFGVSLFGLLALGVGYGAVTQYAMLWRWRRLVTVDGKAVRFDEKAGILVSFESADGPEEFWARAGTLDIGSGDDVTVHYDPDRPAESATARDAHGVRTMAMAATFVGLATGALAIFSLILLIHHTQV